MEVTAITSNDIEFPFLDDCAIPFEHSPEGIKYDWYKSPPAPNGCGGKFDGFG